MERPTFATNDHFFYLFRLQEDGTTNMFGAAQYLVDMFVSATDALNKSQAREVLQYWMANYESLKEEMGG